MVDGHPPPDTFAGFGADFQAQDYDMNNVIEIKQLQAKRKREGFYDTLATLKPYLIMATVMGLIALALFMRSGELNVGMTSYEAPASHPVVHLGRITK